MSGYPPVLDVCCGSRMFWFDRADERALFVDRRRETIHIDIGTPGTTGRTPIVVDPDVLADFRELPFPNESFHLVVFDPPHVVRGEPKGAVSHKYGILQETWRDDLRMGFSECFRVLRPNGALIFKWSETEIRVREILDLVDHPPLFGHRSGKRMNTHWLTFIKARPRSPFA